MKPGKMSHEPIAPAPAEFSPAWFDAASKAWLENKRKIGNGSYRYICEHQHSAWRKCQRDVYKTESMCRQHWALHKNPQWKGGYKPTPKPESPTYD